LTKMNPPTFENLRSVRWNANRTMVLIAGSNGTLIKYTEHGLETINGGRTNLRGISWRTRTEHLSLRIVSPRSSSHRQTYFYSTLDASGLSSVEFQDSQVYTISVSWDPTGRVAAIATSIAQLRSGQGRVIIWNGETFREIYRNEIFFFSNSNIAWSPVGFKLAAIASTEAARSTVDRNSRSS